MPAKISQLLSAELQIGLLLQEHPLLGQLTGSVNQCGKDLDDTLVFIFCSSEAQSLRWNDSVELDLVTLGRDLELGEKFLKKMGKLQGVE